MQKIAHLINVKTIQTKQTYRSVASALPLFNTSIPLFYTVLPPSVQFVY